jgi:hypothetical protein
MTKSHANSALILVDGLSTMREEIEQMKLVLKTNKKFTELL